MRRIGIRATWAEGAPGYDNPRPRDGVNVVYGALAPDDPFRLQNDSKFSVPIEVPWLLRLCCRFGYIALTDVYSCHGRDEVLFAAKTKLTSVEKKGFRWAHLVRSNACNFHVITQSICLAP
jgi:hypothetical protein